MKAGRYPRFYGGYMRPDSGTAWQELCWYLGDRRELTADDLMESSDMPRYWCSCRISEWFKLGRFERLGRGVYALRVDAELRQLPPYVQARKAGAQ